MEITMKTKLLFLLIFILASALYAQSPLQTEAPVSFRSLSLGGIVNDDLDLVYDPIELRFVDSLRLYTNLSNLTSGEEYVFCNDADKEFLIGASRPNPWLDNHWISALVRFEKSKSNSENKGERTHYLDYLSPYNGIYDYIRTTSGDTLYGYNPDNYSFILNNGFLFQDITLGLKLIYGNWSYESMQAAKRYGTGNGYGGIDDLSLVRRGDPSFSRNVEDYIIDSNFTSHKLSEHGDFKYDYDSPRFTVLASGMKPMWGYEFRGDLMFNIIDYSNKYNDIYSGSFEYFAPSITNYIEKYSETAQFDSVAKHKGSEFGIGASARRTFNQQAYRKNDGYVSLGAGISFGSFDYTSEGSNPFTSTNTYFDGKGGGLTDEVRTIQRDESSKDNGDGTSTRFLFNVRLNVPLVDGVHFGIGGFYSYYSDKIETQRNYSYYNVNNYSVTDDLTDHLDNTTTTSYGHSSDHTMKNKSESFTIPVGIEYRFTENQRWALRFGVIFNYYNNTYDDAEQYTDSKPRIVKTEYGDNDGNSVSTSSNDYTSTSNHYNYANSSKNFTYGLGYNATDNLQIDVMGFFDLNNDYSYRAQLWDIDFFKNLRLSFVMKF